MSGAAHVEITEEVIKKTEALAAQGLSQEQIAGVLGFSPDTLIRRKKDNAEFAAAIKRGKEKGIATVTNALFQKAKGGDNVSMIFYLKNRDRDNWKDRHDLGVSGDIKLSDLSGDELDRRIAELERKHEQS